MQLPPASVASSVSTSALYNRDEALVVPPPKVDAVITIGCVIEGATQHDDIVVQHAARKIIDLSLEFGKPVTLGISGPGMTRLEANERIDYAKRAVESAIKLVQRLK